MPRVTDVTVTVVNLSICFSLCTFKGLVNKPIVVLLLSSKLNSQELFAQLQPSEEAVRGHSDASRSITNIAMIMLRARRPTPCN